MSVIDKLKKRKLAKTDQPSKEPVWVTGGTSTTRDLFTAANAELKRIRAQIISGEVKGVKESKLVLARIAKLAEKDRSLLHPRRQPELCDWIERENMRLAELFTLHNDRKPIYRAPSKQSLAKQVAHLRKQIRDAVERERRCIVEEFFASNMLDDRDKLVRENSRLRLENSSLIDKITKLQNENTEHNNFLGKVLNVLTASQRADLVSWRNTDPKNS